MITLLDAYQLFITPALVAVLAMGFAFKGLVK